MKAWDTKSGLAKFSSLPPIPSVQFGPKTIAFITEGDRVFGLGKVWDAESGEELYSTDILIGPSSMSPNGAWLAHVRERFDSCI